MTSKFGSLSGLADTTAIVPDSSTETSRLHQHAFWFFGVLVALAVEQALTTVLPSFLSPPSGPPWALFLEATRLMVFLLVSIRLLLGVFIYFDETYLSAGGVQSSGYRLDFITGFVHFLLLFAWAMSLQEAPEVYPLLLAVILGYDLLWLVLSRKHAGQRLKLWTFVNLATLAVAALIYMGTLLARGTPDLAEILALTVVACVSVIDLAEMTRGEPIFARWLLQLIPESLTASIVDSPEQGAALDDDETS